jgi:hypothetical protein
MAAGLAVGQALVVSEREPSAGLISSRFVTNHKSKADRLKPVLRMASNPNYVKKQIALDTVSWTAVVAPVDCMAVSLKNSVAVDMFVRTDSGDATTQDTISAGSIETVAAPRHAGNMQDSGSGTRFYAGDTIAFLQVASGTGPALLTFVR